MAIKLSNLYPKKGSRHKRKRIARGNASGHGTYSCRGQKGQRSRSGGKKGLKLKGIKHLIKSIPKLKGFKSHKPRLNIINLSDLQKLFDKNDIVDVKKLIKMGFIGKASVGIKVLGIGKLDKKLTIRARAFSNTAMKAIKRAKGKPILVSRS